MTTSTIKQERDKSKKRTAILDGAIKVFSNEGYDLASMDRIAEVAGVSKRTVYNHFGSKEKLFLTIVESLLEGRESRKEIKYSSALTLEEQLTLFAEAEIYLIDDPLRLKLSRILTLVFLKDIEFAYKARMNYAPPHKAFIAWLTDATNDDRLTIDDLPTAAKLFYAMVEGAITWPALFSNGLNRISVEPLLHEIIQTFIARYTD